MHEPPSQLGEFMSTPGLPQARIHRTKVYDNGENPTIRSTLGQQFFGRRRSDRSGHVAGPCNRFHRPSETHRRRGPMLPNTQIVRLWPAAFGPAALSLAVQLIAFCGSVPILPLTAVRP